MDDDKKKISIEGQHNKFQLKRAQREKQRENKVNQFDNIDITHNEQIGNINKIYLNMDFNEKKNYESEIKKKINSYKNQDIKKDRYNESIFINYEETIEKLLISKLKCKYCNTQIKILTNKYRDDFQWTLERIDNNIGHTKDNVIISCLKCNLKRKNSNMDNFEFTQKLIIKKTL